MDIILTTIINGILMGSVYGLTALGLTLIFGVMKVINFAHGSFLMAAMFVTYYLFRITGIDPYAGLIIIVPLLFAFGYFTQHVLIRPVFKIERDVREPISVLMLTAGLWIDLAADPPQNAHVRVHQGQELDMYGYHIRVAEVGWEGKRGFVVLVITKHGGNAED